MPNDDASARPAMPRAGDAAATILAGDLPGVPLYREVKARITRSLAGGEWRPGAAIPSEAQLAQRYGVSIGTLRKAIDDLAAEGVLVRQQGRGTFVAGHTPERLRFRFFHIAGRDGTRATPEVELCGFRAGRASAAEAAGLGIERGAPVWRIRNLLSLAGAPVEVDDITIAQARFPGLTRAGLAARDGTIYHLYQTRYATNVIRIAERLAAVAAPPDIARLLRLSPGHPVLEIRRIAYSFDDEPVELRRSRVDTAHHEYASAPERG
jgi:GntR family transcriptional regulator